MGYLVQACSHVHVRLITMDAMCHHDGPLLCPLLLAGQQLMTGLGLTSDVPDTQQLLAWLEGRPRERFGIVLTNVQELLNAPAEEQQGFLDLLDNILHVSRGVENTLILQRACATSCEKSKQTCNARMFMLALVLMVVMVGSCCLTLGCDGLLLLDI